jgi:hypothetical protein
LPYLVLLLYFRLKIQNNLRKQAVWNFTNLESEIIELRVFKINKVVRIQNKD